MNKVSTHSRLKAAGGPSSWSALGKWRFNTQPPEGGWLRPNRRFRPVACFNTQPPEGGWLLVAVVPLAALCFNTQPPEGGWAVGQLDNLQLAVSTHSRLKAAGKQNGWPDKVGVVSTHSRLKAAGTT